MTVIVDKIDPDSLSAIQEFYSGQNIFVTGGTGFLGKILIEKLLRSCPDIASIYILIRPKKGEDIIQRMEKIFDDIIFTRLKKEVPKYRHKLVAIAGDCSKPGLGLSAKDRETIMTEVSIIFNVAATVRFDEKIKEAVAINVAGTKAIMELSRCTENLKAVVHVSTAYSNCNRPEIDEKFYDPPMTGDDILKLVESLPEHKLNAITDTLLGDFPNTYAFTKCIAEQVVLQYGKDLPVGIFRPAIVVSTDKEPVEGWVDNIYGPTGAIVGVGAGLIRVLMAKQSSKVEMIPVDMTVNALIATAWDVAINKKDTATPPIYNYHASWDKELTWGTYMEKGFKYGNQVPSVRSIWCYSVTITSNLYYYYFLSFLLHTLPAIMMDFVLLVIGQKPRMIKAYKKIHKFTMATGYFSIRDWKFHNGTMRGLWDSMSIKDQELYFFSMKNFNWDEFMRKSVNGLRFYIFKDTPDTIPRARVRMARLTTVHQIIKYTTFTMIAWFLYLSTRLIFNLTMTNRFSSVPINNL